MRTSVGASSFRGVRPGLVALAVVSSLIFAAGAGAAQRTFHVTRGNDPNPGACKPGDCSLREAVIAANKHKGNDTVLLRSGHTYKITRSGNGPKAGSFDITDPATVRADGRKRATVDANDIAGAFEIDLGIGGDRARSARAVGKTATFNGIEIRGGKTSSSSAGATSAAANLKLNDCLITKNTATGGAAAGVYVAGKLTMVKTTISKNIADASLGGVKVDGKARISHSKLIGNGGNETGGATLAAPSTLDHSTVANNFIVNPAGNPVAGISALNRITITHSRLSRNRSGSYGGAVFGFGKVVARKSEFMANKGGSGPAIQVQTLGTSVDVSDSLFKKNKTENGGGGAILAITGKLTVRRSSFESNVAGQEGGAIDLIDAKPSTITQSTFANNRSSLGGAIIDRSTTLAITNSTLSGNTARNGGGIINVVGEMTLNAVTVVRNRAELSAGDPPQSTQGGGLYNAAGNLTVENSIVALNKAPDSGVGPDCYGEFISGGANLLTSIDDCTGFGAGDFVRAKPKLGQLADNGGPTKTVSLAKKSPAIGKAGKQSSPKRDQRNHKRDKHPDIGAFER